MHWHQTGSLREARFLATYQRGSSVQRKRATSCINDRAACSLAVPADGRTDLLVYLLSADILAVLFLVVASTRQVEAFEEEDGDGWEAFVAKLILNVVNKRTFHKLTFSRPENLKCRLQTITTTLPSESQLSGGIDMALQCPQRRKRGSLRECRRQRLWKTAHNGRDSEVARCYGDS